MKGTLLWIASLTLAVAEPLPDGPARAVGPPKVPELPEYIRTNSIPIPPEWKLTSMEVEYMHQQIPTLHAGMKIKEVQEHLGVDEVCKKIPWIGGGPFEYYHMGWGVASGHGLTFFVNTNKEVLEVWCSDRKGAHLKWKKPSE
jgi:hypothetical protein